MLVAKIPLISIKKSKKKNLKKVPNEQISCQHTYHKAQRSERKKGSSFISSQIIGHRQQNIQIRILYGTFTGLSILAVLIIVFQRTPPYEDRGKKDARNYKELLGIADAEIWELENEGSTNDFSPVSPFRILFLDFLTTTNKRAPRCTSPRLRRQKYNSY